MEADPCQVQPLQRHLDSQPCQINAASAAMDIAELETKLMTAVENDGLFGLLYKNTSGMG
jgi:hypothetical protein